MRLYINYFIWQNYCISQGMTYTIYTRHKGGSWDCMLGGFETARKALEWLMQVYLPEADFWTSIEVKVIGEKY